MMERNWIRWFDDLDLGDVAVVAGKNASLGEMRKALVPLGVDVPDGFAATADAYNEFLSRSGLRATIEEGLRGLDVSDVEGLQRRGQRIRSGILSAELPDELADFLT